MIFYQSVSTVLLARLRCFAARSYFRYSRTLSVITAVEPEVTEMWVLDGFVEDTDESQQQLTYLTYSSWGRYVLVVQHYNAGLNLVVWTRLSSDHRVEGKAIFPGCALHSPSVMEQETIRGKKQRGVRLLLFVPNHKAGEPTHSSD